MRKGAHEAGLKKTLVFSMRSLYLEDCKIEHKTEEFKISGRPQLIE